MRKVCKVCGYTIENANIRECPNCGSYDFNIVQSYGKDDRYDKFNTCDKQNRFMRHRR